jgi:hypothetical protein
LVMILFKNLCLASQAVVKGPVPIHCIECQRVYCCCQVGTVWLFENIPYWDEGKKPREGPGCWSRGNAFAYFFSGLFKLSVLFWVLMFSPLLESANQGLRDFEESLSYVPMRHYITRSRGYLVLIFSSLGSLNPVTKELQTFVVSMLETFKIEDERSPYHNALLWSSGMYFFRGQISLVINVQPSF